jgi:hypothetical protein
VVVFILKIIWWWFVVQEKYWWLVGGLCWFNMQNKKHYWLVDWFVAEQRSPVFSIKFNSPLVVIGHQTQLFERRRNLNEMWQRKMKCQIHNPLAFFVWLKDELHTNFFHHFVLVESFFEKIDPLWVKTSRVFHLEEVSFSPTRRGNFFKSLVNPLQQEIKT